MGTRTINGKLAGVKLGSSPMGTNSHVHRPLVAHSSAFVSVSLERAHFYDG